VKKNIGIIIIVFVSAIIFVLQFQYKKTYHPHTYYQVYLDDKVIGIIESKKQLEDYISKQGELIKNQVLEYQEELDILVGMDTLISKKVKKNVNKATYQKMTKAYDELVKVVDANGTFSSNHYDKVQEQLEILNISEEEILDDKIRDYHKVLDSIEEEMIAQKKAIVQYLEQEKENLSLTESEKHYLTTYASKKLEDISYIKQVERKNYIKENEAYLYADNVYSPIGISVEKINTYYAELSNVDDVYQKIIKEKPCTVEGYQFRIKKTEGKALSKLSSVGALLLEDKEKILTTTTGDIIVYVTDESVFNEAVEKLEIVFTGTENFEAYKNNSQKEIVDTGTLIKDVYIEDDITFKKTSISIGEKIYNDADELSSYLLYGENKSVKTVYASVTDDILSLSYKNGISVEEFFLSNPTFTSVNNIFYNNQPIVIAQTNPKLNVVVEQYIVEDMEINYQKEEKYDSKLTIGTKYVDQKGKKGLQRVSQDVRKVNGAISSAVPVNTVILKKAQNEITLVGTKEVPTVGSLGSWYWPTNQGYRISSYFGYRKNPFGSGRELHTGLDIAGTGYGSPVYASNNGVVMTVKSLNYSYGKHIIINHNNGYYTLYGHMSRFAKGIREGATVSRGQIIGYVGDTGAATGPHLHFEIRDCGKYYGCFLNPLPFLRK